MHSLNSTPERRHVLRFASHLAGERMMAALARLQELLEKGGFNPDQPRLPRGGPGGGQWTGGGGGEPGAPQRGIGDNGGPPLDKVELPKDPPKAKISRTQAAKAIARQILLRTGRVGAVIITAVEVGHWLYTEYPSIRSFQDPPKSLEELQAGVGKRRPGYEDHHIVERNTEWNQGFSRQEIDSVSNVVSIPKYKHHDITGWYNTPNLGFGSQTPRNYLRGKDWSEHTRVGHEAMRFFKVMK